MKSLRVPGRIDENDRLILDYLLDALKPQQVELDIILLDDDSARKDIEPLIKQLESGEIPGDRDALS